MASVQIKLLFHFLFFAVSAFGALYEYFEIPMFRPGLFGKFRYLTFWNICFQAVYFGLCVVTDVYKSGLTLQRWRDRFHACVVCPTTMFVFVSFWGLYAIDRELIFPKALEAIFPNWLNHLVHTTILPAILVDKLLQSHRYPTRRAGILGVSTVAAVYISIIFVVAHVDKVWVYPVLAVLSWQQRALFITVCLVIFTSFYLLGEFLTKTIWNNSKQPVAHKTTKGHRSKRKVASS